MKRIWPWSTAAAVLILLIVLFVSRSRDNEITTARAAPAAPTAVPVEESVEYARLRINPNVLLPGDPRRGWDVFHKQTCASCHAIWGLGADIGPDLGRVALATGSAGDLVASFWNHGPRMWSQIRKTGAATTMTISETADLIAFLTFVKTLDPQGDPARGRAILAEQKCLDCHTEGSASPGEPGRIPKLAEWAQSSNPIVWAQRMWAHAPRMREEMLAKNVPWPKLGPTDLADIIAYVRTVGRTEEDLFLRPGSPKQGEDIFFKEGCAACHVIQGRGNQAGPGARGKIDLNAGEFPRTLSGIAALLWNKYPEMYAASGGRAGAIPTLSAQKMADLLSFLLAVRYFDEEGNAKRGRKVFEDRKCATCHHDGGEGMPNRAKGPFSTIELAQAMWNHGPQMAERMAAIGIAWPALEGEEIKDLVKYLDEHQ